MGELQDEVSGTLTAMDGQIATTIAAIWSELLGLDVVDAEVDFFEFGGDSLAAVRMLAAVEEATSVQVNFTDFLEGPTVAALADIVARERGRPQEAPLSSTSSTAPDGATEGRARLAFAQERLWFLEQLEGSTVAYNMPIGARLRGAIDVDAMRRALRNVVSRHEALRTTFATEAGDAVAVSTPNAEAELELIDLRDERDPELEAQRILAEFASRPFNLERGPLVRAALVRLADEENVLELVFHHIVCDGCSQAVVMRELGVVYDAYRSGESVAIGEPRVRYADFARRQREALEARGLDEITAPWLERLAGAPEALELPTDRPRPPWPATEGPHIGCGSHREPPRRFANSPWQPRRHHS